MRKAVHRRAQRLEAQAGYTLTEMLVVIGIIGLIAAVLTPGLMSQLGRARVKAAQLQLETLSSAVEMFHSDVGRYPTQGEGLRALVTQPSGTEGWVGPYVKNAKTLKDPWGRTIVYKSDAEGQSFTVESFGADGKPGGSGVDQDLKAPGA